MRFLILASLFAAPTLAQSALAQPRAIDFSKPDDAKIAAPYAAPGGVVSGATVSLENGALTFVNRAPGSFGVKFNVTPLDVDQITDLDFDFKASPDARVNWFFKVGTRYFGVHFTGPSGVRPGATFLGDAQISDAKVEGWKHAHLPLRGWLRSVLPNETAVVIDEILIGNWDNDGYLMAGIGGNGPGARWQLDNLKLEKLDQSARFGPARFVGQNFVIGADDLASFDFNNLHLNIEGLFEADKAESYFDAARGLVVPLGELIGDKSLKDGQQVSWKLTRGDAPIANGEVKFSNADLGGVRDIAPLPRLQIEGVAGDVWNDMESGNLGWQAGDGAFIERDAANAATGASSLHIVNRRSAAAFEARWQRANLDVAQFPYATFSYRTDDRVRADLHFQWEGKPYSVRLSDRDDPDPRVASVEGFKADNQWHTASVNLLDALKKLRPDATTFEISSVRFSDAGWLGNAKGVEWWLDDWRPAPRVPGDLNAKVSAPDVSGLSGVSWVLDTNPETVPLAKSMSEADLKIPREGKSGLWWLHVRARNGAAQWSQTAHFPIVFDAS